MDDARIFVHRDQEKASGFLARMLVLETCLLCLVGLAIVLGATAFDREWRASSDGRTALAVGALLTFVLLSALALILARVAFLTLVARRVYTYRYELRGKRLSAKSEGRTVGEIDLSSGIKILPMLRPNIDLSYVRDIVVLTSKGEKLPIAPRRLDPDFQALLGLLADDHGPTHQ